MVEQPDGVIMGSSFKPSGTFKKKNKKKLMPCLHFKNMLLVGVHTGDTNRSKDQLNYCASEHSQRAEQLALTVALNPLPMVEESRLHSLAHSVTMSGDARCGARGISRAEGSHP